MKASLRALLVLAGILLLGIPARAQTAPATQGEPEETGQGPQILTSDLTRRQTVEADSLTASFLFVDEQPIVDIRINGEPQKFTQDTSVIIQKKFDNRKEQNVIEVSATNQEGKTRLKSFLVLNPTAVRRFGEAVPKYYRIEDRWDTHWTPLTVARAGAAGAAIGSTIYVIGGQSTVKYDYDVNQVLSKDPSSYIASTDRYEPYPEAKPGAPSRGAGMLPGASQLVPGAPAFSSPLSAASLEQKIYIFESRAKGYVFDPKANTWTTFDTPLRLNRVGPVVAAPNKKLYLFGGLFGVQTAGQSGAITPSLQVWEFDPARNAFTIKKPLPTARGGATACLVKGIIYVFGGYDGDKYLDVGEAYDPAADRWAKASSMPTPRAFAGCVVVNDLIYVAGGRNRGLFGERTIGVMEMFDPATGIWRDRKAVPTSRSDPVTVAIEGVVYVMGGMEGNKPVSLVEAYR